MSDELFTIEQSLPTPLEIARRRLAEAQDAFDEAAEWEKETGNDVPRIIADELLRARNDVQREELRVLNK